MASQDLYGVQTFVTDRKGAIAQGRFFSCKDADEARRIAEARVSGAHAVGAAAFYRTGAGDQDDGEPITIATYGTVPPGVEDTLPF